MTLVLFRKQDRFATWFEIENATSHFFREFRDLGNILFGGIRLLVAPATDCGKDTNPTLKQSAERTNTRMACQRISDALELLVNCAFTCQKVRDKRYYARSQLEHQRKLLAPSFIIRCAIADDRAANLQPRYALRGFASFRVINSNRVCHMAGELQLKLQWNFHT